MTHIRAQTRDGRASANERGCRRTPGRCQHAERRRRRTRHISERAAVGPHAVTPRELGLDARRRRIWWEGTLTDDEHVRGSRVVGENRRLNRACRLSDESGRLGQGGQDGSTGSVCGLHRTRRRSTDRIVVHRAGRAGAMSAGAFGRMWVAGAEPQGDRYKRHRPDLTEQPDRGKWSEHATQMRHGT